MMPADLELKPFRIIYTVAVTCDKGFERLPEETEDEARESLAQELRDGFRQTAYDVPWDVLDWEFENMDGSPLLTPEVKRATAQYAHEIPQGYAGPLDDPPEDWDGSRPLR